MDSALCSLSKPTQSNTKDFHERNNVLLEQVQLGVIWPMPRETTSCLHKAKN